MKLKYRLTFFFLIVIALGAASTLFLVRGSTETVFRSFVFTGDSEKAKVYAGLLADYYLQEGSWSGVQSYLEDKPFLGSGAFGAQMQGSPAVRTLLADRVVLADSKGVIIADTAGLILGTVHPAMHLSHGIPVMLQFEQKGTVLVGSMVDSSLTGIEERFLGSITRSLLISTLVSVALALILGVLFATRLTRPLGKLAKAAKEVASGNLSMPVPVSGNDEISDLSASFNDMTAELKRLDAAKKQIIADSAHELRTPVTLIQGTIEGMIDGIFPIDTATLKSVHEETLRLSRLIDTLRELEIIESGELVLALEGVDMRDLIRKAAVLFASAAKTKSITVTFEEKGGAPALVRGDYLRLGEVVYNLLSNAVSYTPAGGTVCVRLEAELEGYVRFSVNDSGPGIESSMRSHIFERFYRLDKSRSSSSGGRGLGLAIVAEIIKAHGGRISVDESSLGGSSFIVSLPVNRGGEDSSCD